MSESPTEAVGNETLRRAERLCRAAEPHADDSPCAEHIAEARRQLEVREGVA